MQRKFLVMAMFVAVMVAAVGVGAGRASAQAAPPVANAGGPYSGVVGVPIQFSGAVSTGANLTFIWSFGDGTSAVGAVVSHVYVAPALYPVTLTVTDAFGQVARSSTTAAVSFGFAGTSCVQTVSGLVCGLGFAPGFCFSLGILSPFCGGFAPVFVPVSLGTRSVVCPTQPSISNTSCGPIVP